MGPHGAPWAPWGPWAPPECFWIIPPSGPTQAPCRGPMPLTQPKTGKKEFVLRKEKRKHLKYGNKSRLHLEEADTPLAGQGIVVNSGKNNKGTSWYFDGTNWIKGQQKTTINQAPLFQLYDADGISFNDTKYGLSFSGNELVSYKQGEGTNDSVLGFPIQYQNVSNIGDIVFEFDWDDQSFIYSDGTKNIVQDTASGLVTSCY